MVDWQQPARRRAGWGFVMLVAAALAACTVPPGPRGPIDPPPAPVVTTAPEPAPPPVVAAPAPSSLPVKPAPAARPSPRTFEPMRAGDSTHWLTWQNERRSFVLHVPPGYDGSKPTPLVVVLHARGSSAQAARLLGFNQRADTAKFLVAYPEALGTPRVWNARFDKGRAQPDDVGFIGSLLATLAKSVNLDERRVYVTGHSSGGMLAYQVAALHAPRIAAVAVIGASIGSRDRSGEVTRIDVPALPVAVMHIHGALDRTVPYKGGRSVTIPGMDYVSARDSFEFWAAANRCLGAPRSSETNTMLREFYVDCEAGANVELVTITRGGHDWPRTLRVDPKRPANVIDAIWDFFSVHSRT